MEKREKIFSGTVVSNKMSKTVSVEVRRLTKHRKYKKYLLRRKRYLVHAEQNQYQPGDRVRIKESRPLSRRKRFVVIGPAV